MSINALQSKLYLILKPSDERNHHGMWFDWFLIVLILANVVAVILETMPEYQATYEEQFRIFEIISVAIFTIEYVFRVWTCVLEPQSTKAPESQAKQRFKFVLRPMSVVDLLAILPFYLSVFIAIDLRVLRLFRLVRLFKLGRYSRAMQTLQTVIAREFRVIVAALGVLMITMVIAATVMYHLERYAQPEHFGTIPDALWWSVVTLSTVGYGDVVPVTTAGKLFAGFAVLVGVALFALPAGILASSFMEQMALRRDSFRQRVLELLNDGHLSLGDLDQLEHVRQSLGLDKEEAALLIKSLNTQREVLKPKS
ncbi:ion transporter [Alteromonas sp. ASW11-36]|uniref:Ion transporter n=1 Tax=Alteromonas arenosi TaxID=3055817 RepID=A0ABT7T195_9ALTE|nr:ion transporter [Alteromonas sp. ASW11-36]MDM7862225.1 ion transporter [Alteromonas sp. ASW11-36]